MEPRRRFRVIMLASGDRPRAAAQAEQFRSLVEEHADVVAFDRDFQLDLARFEADVVLVFGGDGSVLRAVHQMGYRQLPVVGVNFGRLGFLADLQPDEFRDVLPRICRGEYRTVDHLMFEASVMRDGKRVDKRLGLNEVLVAAGDPFTLVELSLYVDDELVTRYSCDGLIISTPVGSTAHNLSAGGPILRKDLQAFVVSPISPHTLTNRPVVDGADRSYEVSVAEPNARTSVVVDGRVMRILRSGDRVRVERAEPTFKLVTLPGRGYYRSLREKLGWGGAFPLNHGRVDEPR